MKPKLHRDRVTIHIDVHLDNQEACMTTPVTVTVGEGDRLHIMQTTEMRWVSSNVRINVVPSEPQP
jgi:hypothetical protein